nr:hypothetical protein [uncultured Flavobacterium sp.]
MKKIITSVKNAFIFDENFTHMQLVNSLMTTIFKENPTATSIKIFEDFKKAFEQEIAKRAIDSLIENTTCQEYFDRANQQTI